MSNIMKDFDKWHHLKKRLDRHESLPTFAEREIWWCSIGVNIGFEMFGKSQVFTRPVLIVRKFGGYTFLGVPLTSKSKPGYYRYPYALDGQYGDILFDQIRTYDARRLASLKGKVHPNEFKKIKQAMKTCFNL